MGRSLNRVRTNYTFSKKAEEVLAVIKSCFPYSKVYVEYPYTYMLKQYYKRRATPHDQQDRYLLSQNRLHADFVILDYNVVVEVDGEQHFAPVCFGGISKEAAKSRLEDQMYRDNIKSRICAEMEYKLVRIRYDQEISADILFELIKE